MDAFDPAPTLANQHETSGNQAPDALLVTSTDGPTGKVLVLHTVDGSRREALSAGMWRRAAGQDGAVQLRNHRSSVLKRQKSLEDFRNIFGQGAVEHDPTGLIGRIDDLVRLARAMRAALPQAISRIGYESSRRSLYVLLDASLRDHSVAQMRAVVLALTGVVENWRKSSAPAFVPSVRIGFSAPPEMELVAVDAASTDRRSWPQLTSIGAALRRLLGMATLLGFGTMAAAAHAPADRQNPVLDLTLARTVVASPAEQLDDGQAFWSDPTFGLLGVPELPAAQVARRVGQAVEWSVNARAPKVELEPLDVRFYAQSNLVALEGGGYLAGAEPLGAEASWPEAVNALLGLSDMNDQVVLAAADDPAQRLLQTLLGDRVFNQVQSTPAARSTQGYTV
ncbi:MAG: hypothetical protein JG765_597 [Cereibacter sp.]|jgi:hypothetical protein|nr:hypothetical protein [Cereibacter sp.]